MCVYKLPWLLTSIIACPNAKLKILRDSYYTKDPSVMQGVHYLHGNRPLGGYGPWVSPDAVLPSRHGKGLWWQEGPKEGSLLAASSTARRLSSNKKKCSLLATVSKSCSICSQQRMRQQHMLRLARQCKVLLMQDFSHSSWQEMCRSVLVMFDQCNEGC